MLASMGLLADLCFKFQEHPEVLATEALALLLNEHLLGNALGRFLSLQLQLTPEIPADLKFNTQQKSEDGGRPDILGETPEGQLCLIVEAKFWAALTEKQPLAYLEELLLVESGPRALVFVAPAIRHETLWAELTRQLVTSGREITVVHRFGQDLQVAHVGGVPMALMSWRNMLDVMAQAAIAAGSPRRSDIEQLSDLASRMDTEAFFPLRRDELSPQIGRRIYQFNEIVNDVITILCEEGVFSKFRKSGGLGYYGASVLMNNHWLYFEVSYWHWGHYADTPFWLVYPNTSNWRAIWPPLDAALAPLADEVPPRLLRGRYDESPMIPLHISAGVEKHDVVTSLCDQVRGIWKLLPPIATAYPEPAPPQESVVLTKPEDAK